MFLNLHKKSQRAIRLILLTLAYLTVGALVFGYFEYDADMELRDEIKTSRDRLQSKYKFSVE